MFKFLALAFLSVASAAYYEESAAKLIAEVNTQKATWKAGFNPYFAGKSLDNIKAMMGTRLGPRPGPELYIPDVQATIPDTFDARQQWPSCTNIGFIRDQSNCGSCWAVAAAETATDRSCIAGHNVFLAAEDILSCCTNCGDGCEGGYPIDAMKYWQSTGIVTGGPYGSNRGCQPYEIKPCPNGCSGSAPTPACHKTCQSTYNVAFAQDKHFASQSYYVRGGAAAIQKEILTNGPVEAAFSVYEDFMHYTSGVYHHTTGQFLGGHAVKILGWGTESNTPYWLVANSWNTTWGDLGFFKIKRGNNECGFEAGIVAGLSKS